MAKRFTDSDKWKERYFRNFTTDYKLLWFYLWDDCNHAGIWNVDFEIAQARMKIDIKEKEALTQYGNEIVTVHNGEKWFIPRFIEFQYGLTLDPAVKAQHSVLKILREYNLHENYLYGKELPY